jgi:hypothetical protein
VTSSRVKSGQDERRKKMKEEWNERTNERRQLKEITINKHATAYGQTFISEKKDLHIWLSVHKGKKTLYRKKFNF